MIDPSVVPHVAQNIIGVTVVDQHLKLTLCDPLLIVWNLTLIVECVVHYRVSQTIFHQGLS